MSLGEMFQYKYKKNSPNHMLVKCLVEGCPWKIMAHGVEGNESCEFILTKMSIHLR